MMVKYVGNGFSPNMISGDFILEFKKISKEEFMEASKTATSCIGHEDIAEALGLECNRISINLCPDDVLYLVSPIYRPSIKEDIYEFVQNLMGGLIVESQSKRLMSEYRGEDTFNLFDRIYNDLINLLIYVRSNMIGNRLKQLRKQHNITQRQIADFLEISQSQYAKIESGDRNLKLTKLTKLCDLYNVPEEYIIYGEGKPNEDKLTFKGCKGLNLKTLARMNKIIKNLDEMRALYESDVNGR